MNQRTNQWIIISVFLILSSVAFRPFRPLQISSEVRELVFYNGEVKLEGELILPEGDHTIIVEATDTCGDTGKAVGVYNVLWHMYLGPELDGDACNPKDGAEDVDPAAVSEIAIAFSEPLAAAEITNFEPEADISAEVDDDTVIISFLDGFRLPNKQKVVVELTIENLVGDIVDIEYSFTTKAKE